VWLVVEDGGNEREATLTERVLWDALLESPQPPAQAQEPFGYFRSEPFGWTDCASDDDGAKAPYEHPATQPAPVAQGDAEQRTMDAKHAAICRWILGNLTAAETIIDDWFRDAYADLDELHDALAANAARAQAQQGGE